MSLNTSPVFLAPHFGGLSFENIYSCYFLWVGVMSFSKDMGSHCKNKITLKKGEEFLCYSEFLDPLQTKLMLVFISDVGRHILQNSEVLFCDGTFNTCPNPFKQVYFVLSQIKGKRPIIYAYGLLPTRNSSLTRNLLKSKSPFLT